MALDQHARRSLVLDNDGAGGLTAALGAARGLGVGRQWKDRAAFVDLWDDPTRELVVFAKWRFGPRVIGRGADGRWSDQTERAGLRPTYGIVGAVVGGDLDADGREDLVLVGRRGIGRVYLNLGAGGLVDATGPAGAALDLGAEKGVERAADVTDLDADGDLDIVWLRADEGPVFLANGGAGDFASERVALLPGVGAKSRDMAIADIDGDGDDDLYIVRDGVDDLLLENVTEGRWSTARVRSARTSVAGARVVHRDQVGRVLAVRRVPDDGRPVSVAAATGPSTLDVTLSDGRALRVEVEVGEAVVVELESALEARLWEAWRGLRRQLGRLDPAQDGTLAALFIGLLLALAFWARRRGAWLGRAWVALAFMGAYVATAISLAGSLDATRWGAAGVWAASLVVLALVDRRLAAARRARWIGHYRLERELGAGGMGVVYLAKDTANGRSCALKVVHPRLMADEGARLRFQREAALGASLTHANLVEVYEHGECTVFRDGVARPTGYLAMEYVDGTDVRRRLAAEGQLGLEEACRITVGMCRALAALHEADVVHRDVKPDNLLVGADGVVRLSDLGVARGLAQETLTATTDLLGTVAYMSPEQSRTSAVTGAADVYAAGTTLFEMVAGRRPFIETDAFALMRAVLQEPAPELSTLREGIPPALSEIVARCLAKDPGVRPDAAELGAVAAALAGAPTQPAGAATAGGSDSDAHEAVADAIADTIAAPGGRDG